MPCVQRLSSDKTERKSAQIRNEPKQSTIAEVLSSCSGRPAYPKALYI
jgi:hypothetical protein